MSRWPAGRDRQRNLWPGGKTELVLSYLTNKYAILHTCGSLGGGGGQTGRVTDACQRND